MKKLPVLLFLVLAVGHVAAQDIFRHLADSLAKSYLGDLPGGLLIGLHDNGRQQVYFYGGGDSVTPALPDDSSLFELGGLTETFSCLVYADLAIRGEIGLDDPVNKYLPVDVPAPVYEKIFCRRVDDGHFHPLNEQATVNIHFTPFVCLPDSSSRPQPVLLCYLATHTSGLPARPWNLGKNKDDPYAGYTSDHLYAFLREFRLSQPIGFSYRHSELGMALLGQALTVKTGLPFDSLAARHVFDFLGMSHTAVKLTAGRQKLMQKGHDARGREVPYWTGDAMAPAMGMHSSIGDMMKFLAANISKQKNHMVNLLDFTHNPRLRIDGEGNPAVALGWKVRDLGVGDNRLVFNEGLTGGFASWIGFNEANHTGAVVLSSVSKDVNSIGEQLLRALALQKL